ncbi:MAG: hypothetical protein GY869_22175, partial [Planctomycetes bacterium]|nr:hypothetical protein [Planctomycetota bacterium]
MAKKRLNKKLLLILALVGLAVVLIGLFLVAKYFEKFEPEPYKVRADSLIDDAHQLEQSYLDATESITDPVERYQQIREMRNAEKIGSTIVWIDAKNNLIQAINYSGEDRELRQKSLLLLEEICIETLDYTRMVGAWQLMMDFDVEDVATIARQAYYYYEVSKAAVPDQWNDIWQNVQDKGFELIRFEPDDPYGYTLIAHVLIQKVRTGVLDEAQETVTGENADTVSGLGLMQPISAEALLQKSEELGGTSKLLQSLRESLILLESPSSWNITEKAEDLGDIGILLDFLWAQLKLHESESSLDLDKQQDLRNEAQKNLQDAVSEHPNDPEAYKNLFELWIMPSITQSYDTARENFPLSEDPNDPKDDWNYLPNQEVEDFIQEIDGWIEQFPNAAIFRDYRG